MRPLRRWIGYQWLRRVVRPTHRFFRRQRLLGTRMRPAFEQLREAAKKNFFAVFPCFWHLCRSAVKNYWDEVSALGRFVGPVVAALALWVTVGAWTGTEFCLAVTYQGKEIGLVESAAVYDRGAALARGRVINADDSFKVDAVPVFTMTIRRNKATTLSENQVCDAILRQSSDHIAQASGLYIDDVFVGAMGDDEDIRRALDTLKEGTYDKSNPKQRAEFAQQVTVVEGLYPVSAVTEDAAQLMAAAKPSLQVQVVTQKTKEETVPHRTKTVYRDDKPVTHTPVKVKGKDGVKKVVYEVITVNGEEVGIRLVSETITKEPVTQVVEVGTKKTYAADGSQTVQGDGIATGRMTWPVPVCHTVYQGYHGGHRAIDISSGPIPVLNKPVLAADGGKVVYAGWYYDYGYYVKIDHGNGLYTTYSHLNSISVVLGQLVSNGQQIGRVGNTGYSEGPHLHFEVIKDGVKVNPLKYVEP